MILNAILVSEVVGGHPVGLHYNCCILERSQITVTIPGGGGATEGCRASELRDASIRCGHVDVEMREDVLDARPGILVPDEMNQRVLLRARQFASQKQG